MEKKNRPLQAANQDICKVDFISDLPIKPAGKSESFATCLIRHVQGLNALDTNVLSVDDFDQVGVSNKFYTTCLHSDVSKLRNKFGVDIIGESERYQSRHGYIAYFTRYRLADRKAASKVIMLINQWRIERGEQPLPEDEVQQLINRYPDTNAAA